MHIKNLYILFTISLFSLSCSSSYEKLSNNSFESQDDFSQYLLQEYQNKADFEAKKMHDWNSAKLYSEKALKAIDGNKIKPQNISYWNIQEVHIIELKQAFDSIMKIYTDSIKVSPYYLAVAISSLDCWAEQQEENWQTWDINKCKNDYLNAMHNIYNLINEKEKNIEETIINNESNDSLTVITKNKNDIINQIIYFDFDKSNLNEVNLQKIKSFLLKNKKTINKYIIVGHTDTKGTNEYNLKLSLKRALSVQNILIQNGINKSSIKLLGKGESELAIITQDEIAHSKNRRAIISYIN